MTKYITRENLTDFLEKMWDAGLRVELFPESGYVAVYDSGYNAQYIYLHEEKGYETLVDEVISKAKLKEAA